MIEINYVQEKQKNTVIKNYAIPLEFHFYWKDSLIMRQRKKKLLS